MILRPSDWVDLSPQWELLMSDGDELHQRKYLLNWNKPRGRDDPTDREGVCGEEAYAILSGHKRNRQKYIGGDGGVDFPGGVDVKASQAIRPHLLHRKGARLWPRIFVLARVDFQRRRARLLGWEWADVLWQQEPRKLCSGPQYPLNHILSSAELRPIELLKLYVPWPNQ